MAELNGTVVNEQAHKKGKKFFIKLGIILDVLAVVLLIVGTVLLVVANKSSVDMGDENWFNSQASASGKMFGGIALIMGAVVLFVISICMYVTAHKREILAYGASTVLPVADDVVKHVADNTAPNIGKAISGITRPVVDSIADPIAESIAKVKGTSTRSRCPKCGKVVVKDAKFCKHCGEDLKAEKFCPECGTKLETDATFCSNCGQKIE